MQDICKVVPHLVLCLHQANLQHGSRYLVDIITAGLLDGKKATSNNMAFDWVKAQSDKAHWIKHARWVEVS